MLRELCLRPGVYLLLALIVGASLGCARTAVTAGSRVPRSGAPARALVYDDSQRTIPAGQELDLRLQGALNSTTAAANQEFETTTASDLRNGSRVLVPAGSMVRGVVRAVDAASVPDRGGRLALSFSELTANGHTAVIEAAMTQLFEDSDVGDDFGIASEGTLTGGTLHRLNANLTTSVIAADGAVVAAHPGADVVLPVGTIIRIRMKVPMQIQ